MSAVSGRILPLVKTAKIEIIPAALTVCLPGEVKDFAEPQVQVAEIKAFALQEEICFQVEILSTVYYAVKTTGMVEKHTIKHQVLHVAAAEGVLPGDKIEAEAEAQSLEEWDSSLEEKEEGCTTVIKGKCKISLHYNVITKESFALPETGELDGEALAARVELETIQGEFKEKIAFAFPLETAAAAENKFSGYFTNQRATALCGWVKIEGDLIFYLGPETDEKREIFVFPVKYYVEVKQAAVDMEATVNGEVVIIAFTATKENAGVLRGFLILEGKLTRVEPLVLTPGEMRDAHYYYKPDFWFEEVVGFGSSQTLIESKIHFPRPVRSVRHPVSARVLHPRAEVIAGKVIVRGVLYKELLVVDARNSYVFLHEVEEPFIHFVNVPGALPGARAQVHARVEYVKVDINPDYMSARQAAIIEISVKVKRPVKKDQFKPPHYSGSQGGKYQPQTQSYIVKSGDTVWKIARMFGVTMEALIAANNLQNPDLIFPGQKLIIPK